MWIIAFLWMHASSAWAGQLPAPAGAWDHFNEPSLILATYENRFEALPLSGSVSEKRIPWSDSYWQNNWGGIAYRWNAPRGASFPSPDLKTAQSLDEEELA